MAIDPGQQTPLEPVLEEGFQQEPQQGPRVEAVTRWGAEANPLRQVLAFGRGSAHCCASSVPDDDRRRTILVAILAADRAGSIDRPRGRRRQTQAPRQPRRPGRTRGMADWRSAFASGSTAGCARSSLPWHDGAGAATQCILIPKHFFAHQEKRHEYLQRNPRQRSTYWKRR